jgi:hypothetical protein
VAGDGNPFLGSESVPDYISRRYGELVNNPDQSGATRRVTNDAAGAHAAAALIYVEMKKNPSLVTETPPDTAAQVEDIINNPSNPISWLKQKASRITDAATSSIEQNLDKSASFLQAYNPFAAGNSLDYRKLGVLAGGAAALYFLAPGIIAALLKGKRKSK